MYNLLCTPHTNSRQLFLQCPGSNLPAKRLEPAILKLQIRFTNHYAILPLSKAHMYFLSNKSRCDGGHRKSDFRRGHSLLLGQRNGQFGMVSSRCDIKVHAKPVSLTHSLDKMFTVIVTLILLHQVNSTKYV